MKKILMVSIVLASALITKAQTQTSSIVLLPQKPTSLAPVGSVQIGQPIYGGNGCPAGSAVFGNDNNGDLYLLLDKYIVDSSVSKSRILRSSCNLRIPLQVNQGFQVGVQNINSNIFINLRNQNTTAQVTQIIGFVGQKQITEKKKWLAPYSSSSRLDSNLANNIIWTTSCGQSTILSLNSSILLTTNGTGDIVVIDESAHLKFVTRRCN